MWNNLEIISGKFINAVIRASDSRLMLDYVRVINFCIIIILFYYNKS